MNENNFTPIRKWEESERPREKLVQRGLGALTEAELIALILSSGTRNQSALDLGRGLVNRFGGLSALSSADMQELCELKGIGKAKAISLMAAFELGRRREKEQRTRPGLRSPAQMAAWLRPQLAHLKQERFLVISLNKSLGLIGEKQISEGGVSGTVVDVRLIMKEAMQCLASSIVLAHNHPGGSLHPSKADVQLTERVARAADIFGISVVDHIIISPKGYYSFKEEGQIDRIRQKFGIGTENKGTAAAAG